MIRWWFYDNNNDNNDDGYKDNDKDDDDNDDNDSGPDGDGHHDDGDDGDNFLDPDVDPKISSIAVLSFLIHPEYCIEIQWYIFFSNTDNRQWERQTY